jgi:hypothetical protein
MLADLGMHFAQRAASGSSGRWASKTGPAIMVATPEQPSASAGTPGHDRARPAGEIDAADEPRRAQQAAATPLTPEEVTV